MGVNNEMLHISNLQPTELAGVFVICVGIILVCTFISIEISNQNLRKWKKVKYLIEEGHSRKLNADFLKRKEKK